MNNFLVEDLKAFKENLKEVSCCSKVGVVKEIGRTLIESEGPDIKVGDFVEIQDEDRKKCGIAEAVGFRSGRNLLMPVTEIKGISPGSFITECSNISLVPVGKGLVGRVINGLGAPIDDKGPLGNIKKVDIDSNVPNPMRRGLIKNRFLTGIKAIDLFSPIGCGQRMGIFAGSGVGKSTLLGMIARNSDADINVIAMIGERGRELGEFIYNDLGDDGMARSVLVVSTSDESASLRLRAADLATRIAEEYRDQGKKVLLLMDSVTRYAMAQREVGLSVGEPPATRGYPASVFSSLPRLLERAGNNEHGSITALYTVLVEGDDMNEPISDAVRSILDGHILLDRDLALENHYPAINVPSSVSRLSGMLFNEKEIMLSGRARELWALYNSNKDLINIGAYMPGNSDKIDQAIEVMPRLMRFLRQRKEEKASLDHANFELTQILDEGF